MIDLQQLVCVSLLPVARVYSGERQCPFNQLEAEISVAVQAMKIEIKVWRLTYFNMGPSKLVGRTARLPRKLVKLCWFELSSWKTEPVPWDFHGNWPDYVWTTIIYVDFSPLQDKPNQNLKTFKETCNYCIDCNPLQSEIISISILFEKNPNKTFRLSKKRIIVSIYFSPIKHKRSLTSGNSLSIGLGGVWLGTKCFDHFLALLLIVSFFGDVVWKYFWSDFLFFYFFITMSDVVPMVISYCFGHQIMGAVEDLRRTATKFAVVYRSALVNIISARSSSIQEENPLYWVNEAVLEWFTLVALLIHSESRFS